MAKRMDISGVKFYEWTAIRPAPSRKRMTYWHVKCSCGTEAVRSTESLRRGDTHSCGCKKATGEQTTNYKHGMSNTPVYRAWVQMRGRCSSPAHKLYSYYGARGIAVCTRWRDDFDAFCADMLPSWKKGLTLERMDVNGDYEPSNCRWATQTEQMQNLRRTVRVETVKGLMSLRQLSEATGVRLSLIRSRVRQGINALSSIVEMVR